MASAQASPYFPDAPRGRVFSSADLAAPITQDDIDYATEEAFASVTGDDLLNELHDVRDLLVQLCRAQAPDKAGAVVFAVCKGYAARLGMRGMAPHLADAMPDAQRLAAAVLVGGAA